MPLRDTVKDQVFANRPEQNGPKTRKVLARVSHPGRFSQPTDGSMEFRDESIRGIGTVIRDVFPYAIQILNGLRARG